VCSSDLLTRLRNFDATLKNMEPAAIRDFLKTFVEGVEVDMVTKDIQINLILLPWAMRLVHNSPWRSGCNRHRQ